MQASKRRLNVTPDKVKKAYKVLVGFQNASSRASPRTNIKTAVESWKDLPGGSDQEANTLQVSHRELLRTPPSDVHEAPRDVCATTSFRRAGPDPTQKMNDARK